MSSPILPVRPALRITRAILGGERAAAKTLSMKEVARGAVNRRDEYEIMKFRLTPPAKRSRVLSEIEEQRTKRRK